MKKILLLSLFLSSLSFSGDIKLIDFDFCENDKKESHTKINNANHQDTKNPHYFEKKYNTILNQKDFKELSNRVVFSYGKGNKDFFVFIDPECKFCRAFAKGSMKHLEDGTYHIILLPLTKHKDSKKMISFILTGKNNEKKFERFKTVLIEEKFISSNFMNPTKESLIYINNILSFTEKEKIKATPTFYSIASNKVEKIAWSNFNNSIEKSFCKAF